MNEKTYTETQALDDTALDSVAGGTNSGTPTEYSPILHPVTEIRNIFNPNYDSLCPGYNFAC